MIRNSNLKNGTEILILGIGGIKLRSFFAILRIIFIFKTI